MSAMGHKRTSGLSHFFLCFSCHSRASFCAFATCESYPLGDANFFEAMILTRRPGVLRLPGGVPGACLALFVPAHGLEQGRERDRF